MYISMPLESSMQGFPGDIVWESEGIRGNRMEWFTFRCSVSLRWWLCCIRSNQLVYRRKFRSQTSDNMDRWKAEQGRGREKRKIRRKKSRRERVRRKKMQRREKVGKSRNTVFFPMICGSGGSKSRLADAAGAEPAGQTIDEKLHAVVARSTFRSENVQSTPFSDHFWQLRCRKSARRCGAKHIWKSKCTKHLGVGPLLEVEMSKKVHAVVARSTFGSQNAQSTSVPDDFWKLRCRKSVRMCTLLWREAHFVLKMYKTRPPNY